MEGWITHRWADDSDFVVREGSVAKSVLAIALLEDTSVPHSFGSEETERLVFEDGCVTLGFLVDSVFEVAEDHNA